MSVDGISNNAQMAQMTRGAGRPAGRPPGEPPPGPPPDGGEALRESISGLDKATQEDLLSTVVSMHEEGASFEEVKSYIDGILEENGIEPPRPRGGGEGTGIFINTMG